MRVLLLSDIHSNLVAFEAVTKHAKPKQWDSVVFLGDAVGYYTQPNEVLSKLRELEPKVSILGNHDDLLLKLQEDPQHQSHKEESIVGTILKKQVQQISPENLAYLKSFKDKVVFDTWEITHGGLRSQWEYLSSLQNAQANADYMSTDFCIVGHTHVPIVYASVSTAKGDIWRTVPLRNQQTTYRLPPNAKIIFNPGSVGQPRDGIPSASYAIFDEESRVIEHFRVDYDVLAVQRLVRDMDYPESLAKRLTVGK